jgi:Zn-dependent M28 family amino/carboxypeptidase
MPGRSFTGPLPALTDSQRQLADALRAHVHVLSVEIGERNMTKFAQLTAAAEYIETTVRDAGLAVAIQEYEVNRRAVRNVEVEIRGASKPDEIVIVGAHYDSVDDCPAANDNGTGVAATLELARRFGASTTKPLRTVRFVLFVNEEPPYFQTEKMGSFVYARRCRQRSENIVGMISLETIGYYSDVKGSQQYPAPFGIMYPDTGNFIAFVGHFSNRAFVRQVTGLFRAHAQFPSEGGALPSMIPGVGWSDHWSFSKVGYPALMVTDTAPFRYPHYHAPTDTIDKIDFERTARVVEGVERVVADLITPGAR